MNKIAILGAGILGQHIAHYLMKSAKHKLIGFYDDIQPKGKLLIGFPVLNKLEYVSAEYKSGIFDALLMGIGYKHMAFRQLIFNKFHSEIPFATYIHPSCILDASVKVGPGVIALPGCIFDKGVQLKENTFFNIGCMIAHDTTVGEHCFFGPAVKVAGFVKIGRGCFLGINSTIIDNISINDYIQTGAGAVVTCDLKDKGIYIGIPAKAIKLKK